MSQLNDLMAKAYRTSYGELAWKRGDAIEAAQALADAGLAILGGEVWYVLEDGTMYGTIPGFVLEGGLGSVFRWVCEPARRRSTETWQQFCARAAAYTIEVLVDIDVERRILPGMASSLRYNFGYISEAEE
ncbi:MAG: hypothetical protein ACRYFS_22785 [Janthinobacterium lividum]